MTNHNMFLYCHVHVAIGANLSSVQSPYQYKIHMHEGNIIQLVQKFDSGKL